MLLLSRASLLRFARANDNAMTQDDLDWLYPEEKRKRERREALGLRENGKPKAEPPPPLLPSPSGQRLASYLSSIVVMLAGLFWLAAVIKGCSELPTCAEARKMQGWQLCQ